MSNLPRSPAFHDLLSPSRGCCASQVMSNPLQALPRAAPEPPPSRCCVRRRVTPPAAAATTSRRATRRRATCCQRICAGSSWADARASATLAGPASPACPSSARRRVSRAATAPRTAAHARARIFGAEVCQKPNGDARHRQASADVPPTPPSPRARRPWRPVASTTASSRSKFRACLAVLADGP